MAKLARYYTDDELREKLLANCIPEPNSGCWIWTASAEQHGYGHLWLGAGRGQRTTGAHRLSYTLFVGPIPDGLLVMHKCDNPPCINPDHLSVGSLRDNMYDCMAKGRMRRGQFPGEKHYRAKLTDEQVLEIRRTYPHGQLGARKVFAEKYGVAPFTIASIVAGETWKHLPDSPTPVRGSNFFRDKTHCPKGHPYDEANTHYEKRGKRKCRACDRLAYHARKARTGREPSAVHPRREGEKKK